MTDSLYERIGGKSAVRATVARMYEKILEDELLYRFFQDIDVEALQRSQFHFVNMAFGGPKDYSGKDLRTAHQSMKLEDAHFDAVATHLKTAMQELDVPSDLINEALSIVETTRADVLNR